jgi:hypothetical protein
VVSCTAPAGQSQRLPDDNGELLPSVSARCSHTARLASAVLGPLPARLGVCRCLRPIPSWAVPVW